MILLVLGSKLRSERFIILAQISGIYYFSFILVIMRTVGIILNILV
jgi:hypothetical protein